MRKNGSIPLRKPIDLELVLGTRDDRALHGIFANTINDYQFFGTIRGFNKNCENSHSRMVPEASSDPPTIMTIFLIYRSNISF